MYRFPLLLLTLLALVGGDPSCNVTYTAAGSLTATSGCSDGQGSSAVLSGPIGGVMDALSGGAAVLYLCDTFNNRVVSMHVASGTVTTRAGSATGAAGSDDGLGTSALMTFPAMLDQDPSTGSLYVTDYGNGRVRVVDASGSVTTLAAVFGNPYGVAFDAGNNQLFVSDVGSNSISAINLGDASVQPITDASGGGYADGGRGLSLLSYPLGIALDSSAGLLYIADSGNQMVRVVSTSTLVVSTIAGGGGAEQFTGGTLGFSDGTGTNVLFDLPSAVSWDAASSVLYVVDNNARVRELHLGA